MIISLRAPQMRSLRLAAGLSLLAMLPNTGSMADTSNQKSAPTVSAGPRENAAEISARVRRVLWGTLDDAQAGWSRIHAAEILSAAGETIAVRTHVFSNLQEWEQSAQRIGAWRVLAANEATEGARRPWIEKIEAVARDGAAPDRLQAIETLGKLGHGPFGATLVAVRQATAALPLVDALFGIWPLHLAGDEEASAQLLAAIRADDPALRRRAAYIVSRLQPPTPRLRTALAEQFPLEPRDTVAYPYMLTAAVRMDLPSGGRSSLSRRELERVWATANGAVRLEISQALSLLLDPQDVSIYLAALDSSDIGTKVAAASIILRLVAKPAP